MNDYGHMDEETPSLAISLYKGYRRFGIGTAMMKEFLSLLKSHGYKQVSLSVQKANYAAKLYLVYDISWETNELKNILNQRLKTYSNNRVLNYRTILEKDVTESTIDELFNLANSNPKDLWGILDEIFKAQFMLNKNHLLISNTAILKGMDSFVKNFSFYEYYPRRKNARKNTDEFTNDELRSCANTGGSTTNYITGMMNIG